MNLKHATALASVPLLALALGSCGGDDSDDDGTQESSQGAERSVGSEVDPDEFAATIAAATEKVKTLHAETENEDGPLGASTSSGDFDYTREQPDYHVKAELEDSTIERIALGPDVYVLSGERWLTEDRSHLNSGPDDPLGQLAELLVEVETVTHAGEDQHEDGAVRVYRVVTTAPEGSLTQDDDPLTIDLWLDDADRVVRMEGTTEVDGEEFRSTTELSAFDEPVTIEAPPTQDNRQQ